MAATSSPGARAQSAIVRGLAALPDGLLRRLVGRPVERDGQQLHVEPQLALRLLALAGEKDLADSSVAEARARLTHDAATFEGPQGAVEHAGELGADPARIAVGGDSAGGNLAAGVARIATAEGGPAPAFQLLFYPWLDLSSERRSHELFAEGFYLTRSDLRWYGAHYLTEASTATDPRCSPLAADELGGGPPAYVTTAGFDPLRDEGEEYARRLRH